MIALLVLASSLTVTSTVVLTPNETVLYRIAAKATGKLAKCVERETAARGDAADVRTAFAAEQLAHAATRRELASERGTPSWVPWVVAGAAAVAFAGGVYVGTLRPP